MSMKDECDCIVGFEDSWDGGAIFYCKSDGPKDTYIDTWYTFCPKCGERLIDED